MKSHITMLIKFVNRKIGDSTWPLKNNYDHMKIKLYFLCFLLSFKALAQVPTSLIKASISMPTTMPANVQDWATTMPPIIIQASATPNADKRIPGEVAYAQVLVTINSADGKKACGMYTPNTAPEAGISSLVKIYKGPDIEKLLGQTCTLQPGDYQLCVQFYYIKGEVYRISEQVCKQFSVKGKAEEMKFAGPQLISPANGKLLSETEQKQPINFRWTPILPRPREEVNYKVTVVEIRKGQSASEARIASNPLLETTVKNQTQMLTRGNISSVAPIAKDSQYGWYVQAIGQEGNVLATSEMAMFSQVNKNEFAKIKNEFPKEGTIMTLKEFDQNITFRWSNSESKNKEKVNYRLNFWGVPANENVAKFIQANEPSRQQEVRDKTEWPSLAAACCFGLGASKYPNPYLDSARGKIPKKNMIANPNNGFTVVWNVETINNKGNVVDASAMTLFSVAAAGCGTNKDNLKIECGAMLHGKQTYKISINFNNIIPTAGGQQCTSQITGITSNSGTISSISSLPITIPAGNTSSTVTFNYMPTMSGATSASFFYQGIWNDGYSNTSNFGNNNVVLPSCDNCCQNSKWENEPKITTSNGILVQNLDLNNPNTILINQGKNNCTIDLLIKGDYLCNNTATCLKKVNYTLLNNATNTSTTSMNSIIISKNLANGSYTLIIDTYCNDKICKSYKFPIVKDCPQNSPCCQNSLWGEKNIIINSLQKPLPLIGSNLGSFKCNENAIFKIYYNCPQSCPAEIKYSVYIASSLVEVSSTTANSGTPVSINLPSVSGNYQLVISVKCGENICTGLDYYFTTECPPLDCCKESSWLNKEISWEKIIIDKLNTSSKKGSPTPNKKQLIKTPSNSGPIGLPPSSIKIECDKTVHLSQMDLYFKCKLQLCYSKLCKKSNG